ncbi:hypothetical protein [Pedobacter frigoris]|uniref:Uncharacterized protein n=1 Tax=Pedobacter frigoris TaxID=2571272 RepID=A0A4U1CA71_9SPHI|nr:hypothetical protein [Pedobacter frigoris]TKC02765.1 hypothetical protein FA047_20345 [Pedobacter frigoris]
MKKAEKIILVIALIIVGIIIYKFGNMFSAGSYPNAKIYEIDRSEANIIKAVKLFKQKNSKYVVPDHIGLKDGRDKSNEHWYKLYFYYPDTKEIIFAWLRPTNSQSTSFALVSINQGSELGNWKDINKDFRYFENKAQCDKFKKNILQPIKSILKK